MELLSVTHNGGDLAKKIETLRKKEVDVIHLSSCMRKKDPNYKAVAEAASGTFYRCGLYAWSRRCQYDLCGKKVWRTVGK